MARNLTNTNSTTNIYLNRDAIEADLPVEAIQPSTSDPITISLKGLPTSFTGYADKVIKVKTDESGLEYGDDNDTTLWTEVGSNIYPKNVGQVLINTTANTNSRNLLVNGSADIVSNLHFGNNNDIYIKAQAQNIRNYTGYTSGSFGSEHLYYVKQSTGIHTQIASIRTGAISNLGIDSINSGNSLLRLYTGGGQTVEIINNNGGGEGGNPYLSIECQNDNQGVGTSDYYIIWKLEGSEKMRLTTAGLSNVTWRGNTIDEIYGGTGNTAYSTGEILYASASNTLSKLSIGSTDQVLTVIGGVPTWQNSPVPDLTTSTNFGTAVQTGTIKMGNSSGNSYTANIELFVSARLSIFNTGNVEVARFTPASNTCDLSLFGGVLSNATIGANTQYLGTAITYNYGGTGLSSLTANKILQVNSSANGYNLVDLPSSTTQYWSSSSGVLSPLTSTNAIRTEASLGFRIGGVSDYTALDYNQTTNVFALYNTVSNIDFFDYDGDNGYINWGNQASARMNFNNYILHGSGTAYPAGVGMPFGTIDGIYASAAYMKLITTDDLVVNEFNGSPGTGSSNIRCNSSSEIYFTSDKLLCGTITTASSRFRANYSLSRCFFTNPSGTNNSVSFSGSFLAYHDNGTELAFNNPNSSYSTSTSSNMNFNFNGSNRIQMTGSETRALQFRQNDGSTVYLRMGRISTFPSGLGGWSSQAVPIGNCAGWYGSNTNDTEAFWMCQNGQTTACSSTADLQAFRWYNEDSITTGWYISSGGSISSFSDIRLKTEIKDYKNSSFEKYSKIRTVVYKEKIPDNINPKRLTKKSCIDHYNEKQIGVIAQEIYELYPEIKNDCEIREYDEWKYRKDNWNNGVYEKEHAEWVKEKEEYECSTKEKDGKYCEYKTKEPPQEFNEDEPYLHLDYNRINIITIGVVQDLIEENETLKTELETIKNELTLIKELLTKNNIV